VKASLDGENTRLLAVFLLGISLGITATLLWLEVGVGR